jgi:type I restriction-modification system DNA methylase subunit
MPKKESADARELITALVEKYKAEISSDRIKKYTEEDVKKGFILPLFEALGWDTTDRREVSSEEHIKSSGRVDYGFYLNDRPKFYLEAKSVKANIHDEQWARQAIRYSWNKGVTWAVLTNFERLLVFNAQDIKSSLQNKLLFDIPCNDYVVSLDRLELLSKAAFASNELDVYAEKIGKKFQRVPISSLLYKDLDECRELLTRSLSAWNKEKLAKNPTLLDEGVQKLLDRLIFIRVAEDRGVEPPTLIPLVREWEAGKSKNETPLYASMVGKFREFDKIYNSNLFSEHPFEKWDEYDGSTEKAIKILYGPKDYYEYDFKVMPADVLGTVYENYLGHRLLQSKKGVSLDKDAGKRKEQGIYYTPSFVVDYIVEHALQPVLNKCKTIDQLRKIKVLDPACGSGSFLIKALEVLNDKYREMGQEGDETTKLQILTHNIFGVDLDEQAVEIARLNLCINSLDGKMKLPFLTDNIKCGNSLISGTDAELKKHFGPGFRDKHPFNWKEEFPDVFKQGGFDVVIGNPPWSSKINSEENKILAKQLGWPEKNINICALFINKGLDLVRDGGVLAFLLPKVVIKNTAYFNIRKKIIEELHISNLFDFGQFPGVASDAVGLVVEKLRSNAKTKIQFLNNNEVVKENDLDQRIYGENSAFIFSLDLNPEIQQLLDKITKGSKELGKLFAIRRGIELGQKSLLVRCPKCGTYNEAEAKYYAEAKAKICKKCGSRLDLDKKNLVQISSPNKTGEYAVRAIAGNQLQRFVITGNYFILGSLAGIDYKEKAFSGNKILIKRIATRIEGTFTDENLSAFNTVYSIYNPDLKKDYFLATLGILNSSLMRFFYEYSYNVGMNLTTQVTIDFLSTVPIKLNIEGALPQLVSDILNLKKELSVAEEHSNEWDHLKSEIEKTDKKIDVAVYELYGLTADDIKIVEGGGI